jgi:uncharacterized membrane protein YdbT with pleckstrin-like domain
VPFPADVLTADEELVFHLRPHWKAAVWPGFVLAVAVAAVIVAWVMLPPGRGGQIELGIVAVVALVVGIRRGLWPLLVWRCTHYVITDERLLLLDGVLSRDRRDLPLARVNDHAMRQSIMGRLLGYGNLVVDSIGDQEAFLEAVPHVQYVQTMLYALIENAPELEDEEEEPAR